MSEYVGLKKGKVHESHIISEYYCGGCGWPVTDHDSYCSECGGELHRITNRPTSQSDALKTEGTAKNDVMKNEMCDPDDSREQLEADAISFLYRVEDGDWVDEEMWELLDRQAAITHAEINHDAGIAAHEAGKILRKQIDELQEQVDNFCASEEVRNRLIAELTASAKRWADAANEQRLVAIEQADKVQELTAERDEWRAKAEGRESLAGRASSDYLRKLDECDELERERDELRETLKRNPGGCNHHDELRSLQKQRDKWQRTAEDYQKRTEELIDQRSRWIDAAVEIYRRFYPHKDYGVLAPEGVRDMVLKAIDELTAERDEWRAKAEQATNQPTSQSDALKTEETTENGATKSEMRDFDDSREKLEADVRKRYTYTVSTAMWPPSANKHTDMVSAPIDTVLGWLDRQVAITRAEVFGDGEFDCMTCDAKRELQECVEDLSGACELLNGVNEKLREQVDERARRAATRRRRT